MREFKRDVFLKEVVVGVGRVSTLWITARLASITSVADLYVYPPHYMA